MVFYLICRCELDENQSLKDMQQYGQLSGLVIGPIEMKPLSEVPDVSNDISESSSVVASLCSAPASVAVLSLSTVSTSCGLLPKPTLTKLGVHQNCCLLI